MALNKLGDYIEPADLRNREGVYSLGSVRGISIQKCFISTKANMKNVSLSNYKVVSPDYFAYVTITSRNGEKISLAHNDTDKSFLVSSSYLVFKIKDTKKILPKFLYMYFNRPEFDRFSRFNSWGSAREAFSWDDMCDINIDLPSIEIQQKYVDVYNSMVANQQAQEKGLDDLELVINLTLDNFKHSASRIPVGKIVDIVDNRNTENKISNVQGINIEKKFMPSVANLKKTDLSKYKIISKGQFAYSAMQTGRDRCIRIALFQEDESVIISPAYSVLHIQNKDVLPEYFMLWFSRKESDRYGWFVSDGSVRASLELPRFYEIEIPVPSIEEQQSVVNLFKYQYSVKSNIDSIKKITRDLCPILIKGSTKEAQNAQAGE
jgi:type I restriction enzyme S subunit